MKRAQLMAQYQDAVFALMMESIAETEGQEALQMNQQLENSFDEEAFASVNERMEQQILKAFQEKKRKVGFRSIRSAGKRIALVAAAAAMMFTGACAVHEEFRVFVLNTVLEVRESYTRLTFVPEPAASTTPGQYYGMAVDWIPEGYELTFGWDKGGGSLAVFQNSIGSVIEINVTPYSESTVCNIDTEASTKVDTVIQGIPAFLYTKDPDVVRIRYAHNSNITSEMTALWIDEVQQIFTTIHATNLSEEDVIRIAEGVRYVSEFNEQIKP